MRFYIKTFGCQMNEHDSERIAGNLIAHGYTFVATPLEADILLLNTCSVRVKAEDKVISFIGRLASWKRMKPNRILGLVGCMAQSRGPEVMKRFPYVNFIVGTREEDLIPELLTKACSGLQRQSSLNLEKKPVYSESSRTGAVTGFVTIMEGCDNFCSYCIVPYVRGREISRPSEDILEEIRGMLRNGFREVILLGQNVNSYNRGDQQDRSFPELLDAVAELPGLLRIRFVTSHPRDFTPALVERYLRLDSLCDSLHLPVQSGSDVILDRMRRGYTRDHYLNLVNRLLQVRPLLTLSTDIIVGYPGETDEDFRLTLDLLMTVRFDNVFAFNYCVRPGTAAARLKDDVPYSLKRKRLNELFNLQNEITFQRNKALIGETVEALVTDEAKRQNQTRLMVGRSRANRIVHFAGQSEMIGSLVRVTIEDATPNCLYGRVAD